MKHIRKFNEEIGDPRDQETLEEASENYAIDKQNDTGSKYYIANLFKKVLNGNLKEADNQLKRLMRGSFQKKKKILN